MSETSSNNSEDNIPKKKNVSYSTDYLVDLLKVSDKVKSPDKRKGYEKNASEESDNKSVESGGSDLTSYMNQEKNTDKNFSDSYKKSDSNMYSNSFGSGVSNSNIHHTQSGNSTGGQSVFQKPFVGPTNGENTQVDKQDKQEDNPDYDDYNELSPEKQMLKKLDLLRKLGELAQYGVKLSQNYNMNSDYFTMKYEYQLHTNIRAKQNFINWTSSIMLNCIYGLEILNDKYDPFSLKLTNWSQQINADISSYYDVFGEIYEKYNKPGKSMSPELKLILMIGGSALKFHLNQVAAQGKLGIPPIFGLPNGPNGQSSFNNHSQQSSQNNLGQNNLGSQPNPQIIEQMRQQANIQQMMEQSQKQNEILATKAKSEHDLANQQVKDMMFLNQQKEELAKKEAERAKKMQEFEKAKVMFEQQMQQQQMQQQQMQQQQMVQQQQMLQQQMLQRQFPQSQFNTSGMPNQMANTQRRNEIANQLEDMKKTIGGIGMGINMGLTREQVEQPAHVLYKNTAPNVKHRVSKSNISVDTSSSQSEQNSKSSKSSGSEATESSQSENTGKSSRKSSKKSSKKSKSSKATDSDESEVSKVSGASETSDSAPVNSKIERSLSSRNNYSTVSKRKYKKAGITIDTS
jgi:hypothetical protein